MNWNTIEDDAFYRRKELDQDLKYAFAKNVNGKVQKKISHRAGKQISKLLKSSMTWLESFQKHNRSLSFGQNQGANS